MTEAGWYALCFTSPQGRAAPHRTFSSIGVRMLGQLFPERIFSRKLNPSADKRLRLAQARAEESIVQAHVENALMFVDNLAEDLPFDRAIETYGRVMGIPGPLASTVVTRTLVCSERISCRITAGPR